ncbi:hypothetical protein BT63DRAFT_440255 [Microthyrium microscopicum]|uniref:Uncharacterized protein n=1 Tax=Microthyrium microscopicum TaxID=703497 RepID=A0A6A6UE17_9PEZI|nr:hypothetical protein BT63DRAFT_440255 [Microthyrium microscopicum]
MLFTKSIIIALFSAMAIAAPVDTTTTTVAASQDGCDGAFRGEHRSCERGRDQKHDGRREERKGEREIEHGHIGKGIDDILQGSRDARQGANRECRTGGRC